MNSIEFLFFITDGFGFKLRVPVKMADDDVRQKALEDFHFLQNLIANKDQVVDADFPDRKTQVLELLDRALQRGGRRGGPTKVQLLELSTSVGSLVRGNFRFRLNVRKGTSLRRLSII